MGRLRKTGLDKKGGGGGGGGSDGSGSGSGSTAAVDLDKMRGSIQKLVQHTGPLGACMDYIQEVLKYLLCDLLLLLLLPLLLPRPLRLSLLLASCCFYS